MIIEGHDTVNREMNPYAKRYIHKQVNPMLVLQELFELLEDYGPAWYTQEKRERTLAALTQRSIS